MVWRYTLTEIYSRAKTYIWRKAHNLENLEENVIIITGEDNSLRSHCLKPDFIRVFALFSFCYYFILRFLLLCFVDHCLCLCLFSFGHCIVCLLAIVLSVFWPLYCLSFGHCIVCLLAIALYVFWPLYCLSFCHCIVCLLAIVLSVFWPLYCLSFGHCIVCLFAIVLSVFRITASDYPFGFFSSTFVYSNINSNYSTLLIAFVD